MQIDRKLIQNDNGMKAYSTHCTMRSQGQRGRMISKRRNLAGLATENQCQII